MQATLRDTLQERLTEKFRKIHGYTPNLSAPEAFNEKILHKMIFDRRRMLTTFADKIAVRDYVQQRLGSTELLSRIYRIFDGPDDLYTFEFPSRFVLKANHGSGWNYIHHGERPPNRDALVRLGRLWLSSNYALRQGEWCYNDVPPKLFCEENLAPDNADLVIDDEGRPSLKTHRAPRPAETSLALEAALRERMPERTLLGILARTAHWLD